MRNICTFNELCNQSLLFTVMRKLHILALSLLLSVIAYAQENGKLQIHFMDVGQGDGVVLISPRGEVVLFDGGVHNHCTKPLNYLRRLGLRQIDYQIISHYHADHFGCCGPILDEFPLQKDALDRGEEYTGDSYDEYVDAVGRHRKTARAGQVVTLDAGSVHPVKIKIVALNGNGVDTTNENDLSLDCLIEFDGFKAEIGGDLSGYDTNNYQDIETSVAPLVGQIDVYKVHHHASRYSTNYNWLAATRPQVGIVSCGDGNSYRHPTQKCMDALHHFNVKTYWTERGNGAAPEDGLDVVAGNIVVQVAPNSQTFSVAYGRNQNDTYQIEGANPNGPNRFHARRDVPLAENAIPRAAPRIEMREDRLAQPMEEVRRPSLEVLPPLRPVPADTTPGSDELLARQLKLMQQQEQTFDRFNKILDIWEKQQQQFQKFLDSLERKER